MKSIKIIFLIFLIVAKTTILFFMLCWITKNYLVYASVNNNKMCNVQKYFNQELYKKKTLHNKGIVTWWIKSNDDDGCLNKKH